MKAFAADTPTGIYHLKREELLEDFKISDNHLLYSNDWRLASSEGDYELLDVLDEGSGIFRISTAKRSRWSEDTIFTNALRRSIRKSPSRSWTPLVLALLLALLRILDHRIDSRLLQRRNLSRLITLLVSAFLVMVMFVAWLALERMDRQLRSEFGES